jgi:NTE family protein
MAFAQKRRNRRKSRHDRPRVGLAFGGGSARGIAHIGVLRAFADYGVPIDYISGASVGAIIATAYAFDFSLDALTDKARGLSWYAISSFPNLKFGLASNSAVERIMEEFIGSADIAAAHTPLAIVATDIESGEKIVFRKGKAALAVRASTALPGLFVPVEVNGRKLVDGGLAENLPVSPLREMGAEICIGVDVAHWYSEKKVANVLDVMSNSIDILTNHQKMVSGQMADVLIEPDLGAYSSSDFKKADELVKAGYRAAERKIPEILRLIERRSRKMKKSKPEGVFTRFLDWLLE